MTESATPNAARAPQDRYVFKPYPGSSHSWALNELAHVAPTTRVLDIGPGSGIMGTLLSERGVSYRCAVEVDADARAHVAPIYSQVEEDLTPFLQQEFDLILLMDVLEHMADPFGFFAQVSSLLSDNGSMLISVPNVAHWSVRFPLLFGYFGYQERGIMDRTHLQFFTRRRVTELVASVKGYSVRSFTASIEPLELVLPDWVHDNSIFGAVRALRIKVADLIPGLMAYQHLVHLVKTE